MIGFKAALFLWGELVNLALSRDDRLRTQGLGALIDPNDRSALRRSWNGFLHAVFREKGNMASLPTSLTAQEHSVLFRAHG